ncbi:B3 domain-containing protein Os12g0592300-like [Setaria italica]|nr:B3 domain-containing protein Os12g0592300-like [Setaria italica]
MSGWDDFARAHELQENDLLIFTCSGNYSFDVQIFDASGCEKVPCFFTSKKGPCTHKHSDGIVDQQAEHCILSDSDDLRMPMRLIGSPNKASTSKKKSGKTRPRKEPEFPNSNYHIKQELISDEEQSDYRLVDSNYYYYYSRSASNLTGDERDQIFSLASIRPGNPAFVAVLQKTHIGHKNYLLIVHHGFAADHLEGRSHDILLLRPNRKKKWYVRYYHASRARGFNCCRWIKFVGDNRLRKDHICIFELMKGGRRTTMVVHVLRKVDGRFVLVA